MQPFGRNRCGPKIGGGCAPLGRGSWVPIQHNVARSGSKAYLRAKFCLDPFNRLATVHERYRQTDRTGQWSDSIGRTDFGRPFVKRFALCYQTVVCLSVRSVTSVYCRQTVGWIKVKLGAEVGIGPGHIVLDGDTAPIPKRGTAIPQFWPMPVVAKRLDGSRCHLAGK